MTNSQEQIAHTLTQLGLNESDVAIFMLWLEIGAATIAQLAEESGMGRITVHEVVRRLIWYGLMLESRSGRRRLVYPNTVDAIHHLLDARKLAITQLESQVTHATQLLRDIQAQSQKFPTTRYYKGKEGIQLMMTEIMQDKLDVSIISDGQHFYDLVDNDFLEKTLTIRQKNQVSIRMMFPVGFEYFSFTQGIYQQQLDIKFLPDEIVLPALESTWPIGGDKSPKLWAPLRGGMTVRWDKVALHCYEGRYITTTIMTNHAIAQMMLFFFEQVWKGNK